MSTPRALMLLVLAVSPGAARAQTAENLERAIKLYEGLEVERARDMFLQVISPNSPFEVTPAQRVTAYKYLGATLATLGKRDSARTYFRAAIERDPFVDLDPQVFTAQERQEFSNAQRDLFKTAGRPLSLDTLDPRTERVVFTLITTHEANLTVEINNVEVPELRFPLYAGQSNGLREISWNGSLPRGGLVPPGPYELVVTGQSQLTEAFDSTRVLFDISHVFATLEDTLRSFAPQELLPERYPRSAALRDLIVGGVLGGAAITVPFAFSNPQLDVQATPAAAVGGIAILAGVISYFSIIQRPEIPANIAENTRRRSARERANQAIVSRNEARLAETRLVFMPVVSSLP